MSISTNFIALPNDHFRITSARNTTKINIMSRPDGGNWSTDQTVTIPDGSYTVQSMINAVNNEFSKSESTLQFLKLERSQTSRMYILKCTATQTLEYAIGTAMVSGQESGGDMLGFTKMPGTGVKEEGSTYSANRPPDLHGTQTITIKASVNAQNNLDPHNLTRKRSVLAVIPAHSSDLNQPGIWDQYINKEHVMSGVCLDVIELALEDDMGLPMNPNNHWAISLEIKFKRKRDVTTEPSRNFSNLNKHALLRGSRH